MDISTNYLGIKLPHPLVPGASPLSDDLDTVKQLEDGGASAIVLRSLFEEQINREQQATHDHWAVTTMPLPKPSLSSQFRLLCARAGRVSQSRAAREASGAESR